MICFSWSIFLQNEGHCRSFHESHSKSKPHLKKDAKTAKFCFFCVFACSWELGYFKLPVLRARYRLKLQFLWNLTIWWGVWIDALPFLASFDIIGLLETVLDINRLRSRDSVSVWLPKRRSLERFFWKYEGLHWVSLLLQWLFGRLLRLLMNIFEGFL